MVPSSLPSHSSEPPSIYVPREIPYTLIIKFDKNPEELAWKLVQESSIHDDYNNNNYRKITYGEKFGHYNIPCIHEKIQLYLLEGSNYTFTIYDKNGTGMTNVCDNSNFTSGYALYEGYINDLTSLVWEREGDSFTDIQDEMIIVTLDEATTMPSTVPSISHTSLSSHPSNTTITIEYVNSAYIFGGVAFGVSVFSVFGFIIFKMLTMRQRGRPVPSEMNC